jgi:hypothetical protein
MAGGVSSEAADVLGAVITVAAITVLVRPGSQGPTLVTNFLKGFSGLIGSATNFGNG